jgi:hypothetical protein
LKSRNFSPRRNRPGFRQVLEPRMSFAYCPPEPRRAPALMECAGRAQRRRRFSWDCANGRWSQSGVALHLPPHSKSHAWVRVKGLLSPTLPMNRQVVGRASRLPSGRLALERPTAGETPGAAGETPAPLLPPPGSGAQSASKRRGILSSKGGGWSLDILEDQTCAKGLWFYQAAAAPTMVW